MTLPKGVEQWMVDTYEDNVRHQLQQTESVLESTVTSGTMDGKKKRFKYIGKVEMSEVSKSKGDTNWIEFDFWNRWCFAKSFSIPWLSDKDEIVKMLTDPNSDMVKAAVAGGKRQKDKSIIEAFSATSYHGDEEEMVAIAFPDKQVIDIQFGAEVNTGLNLAKLYEAKYYMDEADMDPDEQRFMSVTAYQLKELLQTTEIKNVDYNNVKALVNGKIDTFLGFTFKRTQLFPFDPITKIRRNFAWTKSAMLMAVSREINYDSAKVATKNFNIGNQVEMRLGAVRLFDEGVVEVPCHETPRAQ